jgi:hypothetical protein
MTSVQRARAIVEALLYLHATRCFDEFSVIN